jgi:hypothetical protein
LFCLFCSQNLNKTPAMDNFVLSESDQAHILCMFSPLPGFYLCVIDKIYFYFFA